eukprot:NODE_2600_length_767_cov_51.731198_g1821_i0.p3 GENE.NODE_2600_length_767_cov_51.731198_g1821_i0~~NODE_2600_length_767_cov_51.731198_g1821_i0.p3  ORF type:complete len:123 (+),score=16.03 NODE_2600_length_767_cov_51.731198_g1821_i0:127-495(+)
MWMSMYLLASTRRVGGPLPPPPSPSCFRRPHPLLAHSLSFTPPRPAFLFTSPMAGPFPGVGPGAWDALSFPLSSIAHGPRFLCVVLLLSAPLPLCPQSRFCPPLVFSGFDILLLLLLFSVPR